MQSVVKCAEETEVLTARKQDETYLIILINQHIEGCN
jgi:hypothetical protein